MSFVWFSERTVITSLNSFDQLIFVMETPCVFFEVGTEFFCTIGKYWLVGDHFFKSLFALCVVITVTMVMLLGDFGPYGKIFMMCV
jgi:hypothetical protein